MNRTIVVTGASDGIGAVAARGLVQRGNRVVIVGRNAAKTAAVAKDAGGEFLLADYTRLDDVRALAAELNRRCERIDVLMNNAGGIMGNRELTPDGYEKTFQVNHLGGFLLTALLLDKLKASDASVINTSSLGNRLFGNIDINDLQNARRYSPQKAYGDGKLENILHAKELQRRFGAEGLNAVSVHPGGVATNFSAESNHWFRVVYRTPLARLLLISPAQGAAPLIRLASEPPGTGWQPGAYYDRFRVGRPNKQARDLTLARQLWEHSAELAGVPELA
jgi:NAD(P)-dependent dehydrogenase (short-subunit alcohol dehydrogenase family)